MIKKTAISIPEEIFDEVEKMKKELHISRSKFVSTVLKDYIERQSTERIVEALNRVYSEEETKEEKKVRKLAKEYHAKLMESEKW